VSRPLERLFRPRGIAVVGASRRTGTLGARAAEYVTARSGGAPVYLVNPAATDINDVPCYPNIAALPAGLIDVAFLLVPTSAVVEEVRACAARGIPFAIVGSRGFADIGETGAELQRELGRAARDVDIALVGPNTNGLWNAQARLSIGFNVSHGIDLPVGGIGIAAQSGAMLGSLLKRLADLGAGISCAIAGGNEEDLELADYVEFLAHDSTTTCVLLLIDAVRNPRRFANAVLSAKRNGKPVIALKLGKSAEGILAAELHSSRLAGAPESFGALLRKLSVAEATDIETLAGAAHLVATRRSALGNKLAAVSTSGGGAALLADHASRFGFTLPPLSDHTASRLRGELGFISTHNPLDLPARSFEAAWVSSVFEALLRDDCVDVVMYLVTLLYPRDTRVSAVTEIARTLPKSLIAYAPGALDRDLEAALKDAGVFLAHSAQEAFGALRTAVDALATGQPSDDRWLSSLPGSAPGFTDGVSQPRSQLVLHDEARPMLERIGMSFPREEVIWVASDAAAAAERVGFPVALKILADDLPHKASQGGVRLYLTTVEDVQPTARDLLAHPRLGARLLVQHMVPGGIELYLGFRFDPQAGAVVIVGLGGSGVETERDLAHGIAPLTPPEVRDLLSRLRGFHRTGMAVLDLTALIDSITRFSQLVAEEGDRIESLEINPLILAPDGTSVAVDVRMLKVCRTGLATHLPHG